MEAGFQSHLDIINVAGLLMMGDAGGLGKTLDKRLQPRSIITIAPTPPSAAAEDPEQSIERAILLVRNRIDELRDQHPDRPPAILLTGRSNGGFMVEQILCRLFIPEILGGVAIEAPVHPDIEVRPPALIPPLRLCYRHYEKRPRLAAEAMRAFEHLGTSKLTFIQGGREDSVVPTDAQVIPGNFQRTEWPELGESDPSRGEIICLPKTLGGRAKGLARALPDSYRTHLFWSDEKMDAVVSIIARVAKDASGRNQKSERCH